MKKIVLIAGMLFFTTITMAQDFNMPVASPKVTTKQQFSTSNIELEYSRPSAKGRKVFGEMISFGKPWRTGANATTKISFGEEVSFGGQKVAAGTYALYTIPNKDSWTVILNSDLKGSLSDLKSENDVAKVNVKPTTLNQTVETFTIEINDIASKNATLNIIWENTKVSVAITADNQARILAHLEKELKGDKPPYRDAAFYYYEIGQNLDKAVEYADKVLAENPKAFWIQSLKANIYKKLGKKKEALDAAQKAADLTKGTGYEAEYAKKAADFR